MGCAQSASDSRHAPGVEPHVPSALESPLPHGHHLLAGLAKSLELEYGPCGEKGTVSTWMTLELEARPQAHLTELGTDLQACCAFVSAVESSVANREVTIESLRELWGCPGEIMPMPKGPVTLADLSCAAAPGAWHLRQHLPTGGTIEDGSEDNDSLDNDVDNDLDTMMQHAGDHSDTRPDGDGRYSQ